MKGETILLFKVDSQSINIISCGSINKSKEGEFPPPQRELELRERVSSDSFIFGQNVLFTVQ